MDYKEKFISLINDKTLPIEQRKKLEEIYNSCVESEDERIRRAIIETIEDCSAILSSDNQKRMIAWLEKQAPKPQGKTALEAINEEKVDNSNKVEPAQEIDGFEVELNSLLKKYEYLPKEELQEPLEFYLGVVRDNIDVVREDKPKWSEEDEENLKHCCYFDKEEILSWLNSIKQRMVGEEIHVLNKGVAIGRREMLDKAGTWLANNAADYVNYDELDDNDYAISTFDAEKLISDFKEAMEK